MIITTKHHFVLFTFLYCFFSILNVQAFTVSGRVTGNNDEPLAFANVYVKGTSTGTTTNLDGYYKLELTDLPCELVYRYLGYKLRIEKIGMLTEPLQLNVKLEPENFTLAGVTIKADSEDPAYAIIRKAQAKRKFYQDQVDAFNCDVYIKGLQKITKYPKKILGMEVNFGEFVDSVSGIIYLSESVSKIPSFAMTSFSIPRPRTRSPCRPGF